MSERELVKRLMPYTGHFAKPTIVLFLISLTIYFLSSYFGAVHLIPLWLTCGINTICAYLLFTPLHEATHQNIKGRKMKLGWVENTIGWISSLSLMAPFPVFRALHIVHHNHTNNPEKDPDYWVASKTFLGLFLRCITIYFIYHYHYFRDIRELSKDTKTKKGIVSSAFAFFGMNFMIVFFGMQFGWGYVLAIYVLPAILALAFLAFAFDWLPHHPHSTQQKYLDTRILLKPGLSTILVSQNMHLIHHLYSGIPFYHYADAYQVLEKKLKQEGARIEGEK